MDVYVLCMSTDHDILTTQLDSGWNVIHRNSWRQIQQGNCNIPAGSNIVVIAHGNDEEIGNAEPGEVDINADYFLSLIEVNIQGPPQNIFISVCQPGGMAQFAARVVNAINANSDWMQVTVFGHEIEIDGKVPNPDDESLWTPIYQWTTRSGNSY